MFDPQQRLLIDDPAILPVRWRSPGMSGWIQRKYEEQRSGAVPVACIPILMTEELATSRWREPRGLADLASRARRLLRGEVVRREGGFLMGAPGLMIEVAPSSSLLREATVAASDGPVFVFYPVGPVPFGVTTLCPSGEVRWPGAPGIGEEVIVLPRVENAPVRAEADIIELRGDGQEILLTGERGGVLAVPELMDIEGIRGQQFDDVWDALTRAFMGDPGGSPQ